ncbi:hypothetical protein [Streptomyces sp. NPDC058475]|uniref:hypothetical protein n=1 Tax=unclassified Streptomyces TaxID=2593676 RepID=UPI00365561EF
MSDARAATGPQTTKAAPPRRTGDGDMTRYRGGANDSDTSRHHGGANKEMQ